MKRFLYIILVNFTLSVFATDISESDFYTDYIDSVSKSVNLATDYGANGSDKVNDTENLQNAIDELAQLPNGGKIIIPKGNYIFKSVKLKSNIHIVIEAETEIKPLSADGEIFDMGLKTGHLENVSIRGSGGLFTVDLRSLAVNEEMTTFHCGDINNFLICDFQVLDNNTTKSVVRCTLDNSQQASPTNGVVKNGHNENAHIGYGTIQCGSGRNILFKNLSGRGGVTLRLESGAGGLSHLEGSNFDLYGRNISCTDGNAAVMISPHAMHNGFIDINGVIGESCASAVRIDRGDLRNGEKYGYYAATSILTNVHAIYGITAEIKNGRNWYVPCSLRHLISKDRLIEGKSWQGPACAAIINTADCTGDGCFNIQISNITQEGFEETDKLILTETEDRIKNCPDTSMESIEQKSVNVYPNPVNSMLYLHDNSADEITIFNACGNVEKQINTGGNTINRLNISSLSPGLYILQLRTKNKIIKKKIVVDPQI